MQASGSTTYELRLYASEGAQAVFEVDAQSGYTDGFMISLAQALKGLTWPVGQTPQVSLTKTVREDDTYTADLTAVPPVFN